MSYSERLMAAWRDWTAKRAVANVRREQRDALAVATEDAELAERKAYSELRVILEAGPQDGESE